VQYNGHFPGGQYQAQYDTRQDQYYDGYAMQHQAEQQFQRGGYNGEQYDHSYSTSRSARDDNRGVNRQQQQTSRKVPAKSRNMVYQKSVGMDAATPALAANRNPDSFFEKGRKDPKQLNEQRVKTHEDQLAFSKKARPVDYTPGTLKDYKQNKPQKYYELGKLSADLEDPELIAKKANQERVKQFSANLRGINKQQQNPNKKPSAKKTAAEAAKEEALQRRKKAQEFAKNVPKPKLRHSAQPREASPILFPDDKREDGGYDSDDNNGMSLLDDLEFKHQVAQAEVDAIRKQFA